MSAKSYRDRVEAWFERRTGRKPASIEEAALLHFDESFKINPRLRRMRDEVVEYAESKGGVVLDYAQARWGHYWNLRLPQPGDRVNEHLGLTEEEGKAIFGEIMLHIAPIMRDSPERALQPSADHVRAVDLDA